MLGALFFMSGTLVFALPLRGHPLATWFWWPGRACMPESHRTVTTGEKVLVWFPPRALQDNRLKCIPNLSMR